MGIRPMLSSLIRSKTGPTLVALQIGITIAIVINAVSIIVQRIEHMNRDPGMDTNNVIVIYARGFAADFDRAASVNNDIELIRSIPGVITATVSNHVPLSGSGSATGLRIEPDENVEPVPAGRYRWSEEGLAALGIELSRGRNFLPQEVNLVYPDSSPPAPPSVLITQDLADDLFGEDDALGKSVYWGSMESSTVVGIIDHMHGSWVNWDKLGNVVVQPGKPLYTTNKYLVRVEPGRRDQLMPVVERELGESNRQRVIKSVRSLEEMAADSYRRDRGMAVILSIVITLLIGLLVLVIAGLSSFNVTQRKRQIGTRRALGATRAHIVCEFALESWLVSVTGSLLGVLLTVLVAYWLETTFALPRLDWRYLPTGILVLWLLSLVAVLEPARRAASVPPAVATRSI